MSFQCFRYDTGIYRSFFGKAYRPDKVPAFSIDKRQRQAFAYAAENGITFPVANLAAIFNNIRPVFDKTVRFDRIILGLVRPLVPAASSQMLFT